LDRIQGHSLIASLANGRRILKISDGELVWWQRKRPKEFRNYIVCWVAVGRLSAQIDVFGGLHLPKGPLLIVPYFFCPASFPFPARTFA
jgi:hypothetical protein